ncbi:UPF0439 protein C9orf30 like protein, partial [Cyphomyrmex costatus]
LRNMESKRAKNFTDIEKSDLIDKIFRYRDIIENKQTDNTTIEKKNKAWTDITNEYNENRIIIRTERNLRSCWDNIKRDTRKYCAARKRECYKTAQEIMGVTATSGLYNPFDSDSIDNEKENIGSVIEIEEDDNKDDNDDSAEVFTYLLKNQEIVDWKSWDRNKLKSQISPPLKENIQLTTSTNVKCMKRKYEDETLDKAKTALADVMKTNIEEKQNYEIELLKAKLEKENLKINLLKITIEKEKLIIDKIEKQNNMTFTL